MEIVSRNYKKSGGEIDIIAKDGAFVVFIEVKTRRNEVFAAPRESVGSVKRRRLRVAAEKWLAETGYAGFCRFDVIEVITAGETPLIRHWRDAF
jgi:putative endonuclease